jgi:type I restriction-modification system DNA methylase subunit
MSTSAVSLNQLEFHLWERKGKILLINAVNEVTRVATLEEIRAKDGNLSIPLYVTPAANGRSEANPAPDNASLPEVLTGWLESSRKVRESLHTLIGKT